MNIINNIIPKCNLVNIVWVDRGILLSIIAHIVRHHSKLIKKTIIINNKRYRKFLRVLFPELKFKEYVNDSDNNFYFNIRTIIKKQDVFIDYLSNYEKNIPTANVRLIPWFDMNDPLIIYKYNDKKNVDCIEYKLFIKDFVSCTRANYNGFIWDAYMETRILKKYTKFSGDINIISLLTYLNNYLSSEYTDTVNTITNTVLYPQIYYQPNDSHQSSSTLTKLGQPYYGDNVSNAQPLTKTIIDTFNVPHVDINENDKVNELIKLINDKVTQINEIIN